MPRIHTLRNKCFLYVCLLGLATTILTMTLGIERLPFIGNVRYGDLSMGDIAISWQSLLRQNGSNNAYQKELHNKSEVAINFQPKQIPSGGVVYSINKANGPKTLLANNTGKALKESQNKPVVQGLAGSVDNKQSVDNKKNDVSQMTSPGESHISHNFLNDFLTYPCIKGLSEFQPERWETDGKCVRTVNYTESAGKIFPDHKCVNVRTAKGTLMPICVYPAATDKYVSASVVKGNLWERDLVNKMTNYINLERQKQPDIEFLDLGSNIGCYSLNVAQEGIHVTAIDPLHGNMELLSKSIVLGKVHDRFRLIWNAVADHHNVVKFIPDINNVGGTRITDINPSENKAIMDVARAITFDDLLPLFRGKHIAMKMDIEESEYPALIGGEKFFQEVDVKVVQMEFQWHKKGKDGPKIVEYFSKKGFQPFGDFQQGMVLNSTQMAKWPNDIYFMKPNKH